MRKSQAVGKFKTQMNFRGKKKERSSRESFEKMPARDIKKDLSLGSGKVKRKSRSQSRKKSRRGSKNGPKVFASAFPDNSGGRVRVRLSGGSSTPKKKSVLSHESHSTRAASMNPKRGPTSSKLRSGHSLSMKRAEAMFKKSKEEDKEKANLYVRKSWKGKTVHTNIKKQIKLVINGETPITLDPITVRKSNSDNSKVV